MGTAAPQRIPASPVPPPNDHGRTAVVAWLAVLGVAGLVAVLIAADLVRKASHAPLRPALAEGATFWLFLLAAGGVGLFLYGFKVRAMQRVIENTPTSTVRSLPLGFVEVAGTALPDGEALLSPLTNQPCVFYRYRIEEQRGSRNSRRWVTVAEDRSSEPFYLEDSTGRVLIVPMGADARLSRERVFSDRWPGALPDHVARTLRTIGEPTASWLGPRTLRCREAYIAPGDPLYVLGTAQENPSVAGAADNAARIYIGSHPDNPRYLISDRSEKALLARLRLIAAACLYGGPLLTALSLAFWAMRGI
jgi:hypothetical protein